MIFMKIGHELANAKRMHLALQRYMEIRALEEAGVKQDANAAKDQVDGTAELSAGFLKESKWWAGMATYGVGSLMHVASLGFGPSALLNPMEGLTLVANTLSAPPLLGEELTNYDIVGTAVIVGGTMLVVFFGPHSQEEHTADQLLAKFGNTPFVMWSVCIWSTTGVAYGISKYIEHINQRDGIQMDGSLNPRGSTFLALMYTSTKGVMGGYTMLFGKMFAEVCAESGEGENQFVKWETYLFFVLFVAFNFGMEYWRQKALNLFSTMYCVPLFQVSLVIFSVFTGAIFFDEFSGLSTLNLTMFFVGVIVICIGVVILSVVTENRKLRLISPKKKMKAAFWAVTAICFLKAGVKKTQNPKIGIKKTAQNSDIYLSLVAPWGAHKKEDLSPQSSPPVSPSQIYSDASGRPQMGDMYGRPIMGSEDVKIEITSGAAQMQNPIADNYALEQRLRKLQPSA